MRLAGRGRKAGRMGAGLPPPRRSPSGKKGVTVVDLSRERVLVTGGSRGIGAAMVAVLAGYGARVALHYGRSRAEAERLQERLGPAVVLVQADLARPGAGTAVVEAAAEQLSGLTAVVNNAGIFMPAGPTESWDRWQRVWAETLQVNLVAAADVTRAALPLFSRAGGGCLVYISSRAAFRGDDPDYLAYAASKGGMVALARSVARGYAQEGVVAFTVAPGFVATEMARQVADAKGDSAVVADIPMGEMAPPADVAEVVAFLVSGRARHMTGATLDVNGASYVR
jgi:3-oxoacyl-[acyl-carrier protein] reductase